MKMVDLFLTIDHNPFVLKGPLLPYSFNCYRIPLFIIGSSWYPTKDFEIESILINGGRFPYWKSSPVAQLAPPKGRYTIHEQVGIGKFICITFDFTTLWMYKRLEVVATEKAAFSLYGTKEANGDPNPPMILKIPEIKRKADALKYARFSFESVNLTLIYDNQRILLYGGEMALKLRAEEDGKQHEFKLGRYIIDKVEYNKETAQIRGIDYRYLFNTKFPVDVFTKEEFPYIEDEYVDKIKPEMIGYGNGVPGICLNGNQIYGKSSPLTGKMIKIASYDFRFPPGYSAVSKVEAKIDGRWIELYPGYGNPYFDDGIGYKPVSPYLTWEHIYYYGEKYRGQADIVSIPVEVALQDGKHGNAPNEVRMYALWSNFYVQKALKYLMDSSGDTSLSENSDLSEGEYLHLSPIGLYMDESKPVFEWIERIQSGNVIGGQLMLIDDKLIYRLENPNREKKTDIPETDVLNHHGLPVAAADELWFSGWNIAYKKSWAGNEEGNIIGNTGRYPTAEVYNANDLTTLFRKGELPTQQWFDTSGIQTKINILNDTTTSQRHRIDAIEVPFAVKYLKLEIYDVVGYMPEALEDTGITSMEWMIYEKK